MLLLVMVMFLFCARSNRLKQNRKRGRKCCACFGNNLLKHGEQERFVADGGMSGQILSLSRWLESEKTVDGK